MDSFQKYSNIKISADYRRPWMMILKKDKAESIERIVYYDRETWCEALSSTVGIFVKSIFCHECGHLCVLI